MDYEQAKEMATVWEDATWPSRPEVSLGNLFGWRNRIIQFCGEEVSRQGRTPIQVWWMLEAWAYAWDQRHESVPTEEDILTLAALVERETNHDGYRTYEVWVGHRSCPKASIVPSLMAEWYSGLASVNAPKSYYDFEIIHPFGDGNGRVGKIIFNWLNDSLSLPRMPPDFWHIGNP